MKYLFIQVRLSSEALGARRKMKWIVVYFEEESSYSVFKEKHLLTSNRLIYKTESSDKVKVDFFGNSVYYDGIVVGKTGMSGVQKQKMKIF